MSEDEALYNRFLAGDNIACLTLFQRYHQRLFTYCLKMVGEREHAEDLAQEVWERMVELRATGRTLDNPIGFLMRIARNLCLDHLKTRRRLLRLDELQETMHPVFRIHEPTEMEELAVVALQKLPFNYREVLVLNIYCGYSFEEIAVMLGKSPEAIWTRASRARAQLRKMIRDVRGKQSHPGSVDTEAGEER